MGGRLARVAALVILLSCAVLQPVASAQTVTTIEPISKAEALALSKTIAVTSPTFGAPLAAAGAQSCVVAEVPAGEPEKQLAALNAFRALNKLAPVTLADASAAAWSYAQQAMLAHAAADLQTGTGMLSHSLTNQSGTSFPCATQQGVAAAGAAVLSATMGTKTNDHLANLIRDYGQPGVGHRVQLFEPGLTKLAYGAVQAEGGFAYYAVVTFNKPNWGTPLATTAATAPIAWPAPGWNDWQYLPTKPASLGYASFRVPGADLTAATVTVTRQDTGERKTSGNLAVQAPDYVVQPALVGDGFYDYVTWPMELFSGNEDAAQGNTDVSYQVEIATPGGSKWTYPVAIGAHAQTLAAATPATVKPSAGAASGTVTPAVPTPGSGPVVAAPPAKQTTTADFTAGAATGGGFPLSPVLAVVIVLIFAALGFGAGQVL